MSRRRKNNLSVAAISREDLDGAINGSRGSMSGGPSDINGALVRSCILVVLAIVEEAD